MLHLPSKAVFHLLAQSAFVKRMASKHGMRADDGFARRFIAGETIEEALGAAKSIQDQGYLLTLDYLGASTRRKPPRPPRGSTCASSTSSAARASSATSR